MKAQKALRKYSKKHSDAILVLLKKSPKLYAEEDFHQLRVEIKKVHALFSMLDRCSPGFEKKKFFKPYKKIFTNAGKIRELQLTIDVLREIDKKSILKNYYHSLDMQIRAHKREFATAIKQAVKKIIYNKIYNKITIDSSAVGKYLDKKKKKIKSLQKGNRLQPSDLHNLRKQLKAYCYNKKSLDDLNKKLAANADRLQQLMGQWHDYRVISRQLSESIADKRIAPHEVAPAKKLISRLNSKSSLYYQKINSERKRLLVP